MSAYSLLLTKRAQRELSEIDAPIRKTIIAWMEKNLQRTESPRAYGKALTGDKKGYWRYRVGFYRIIAEIRDEELVIIAISIAHRSSVYEKL